MTRSAALQRDDDGELDERAGRGFLHRTPREFRRHPTHPVDHRCSVCGAVVHEADRKLHAENHRLEAAWEDKVEMLEAQLEHLRAEFEQVRGQWETVERLVAPGVSHMLGMMEGQDDASG